MDQVDIDDNFDIVIEEKFIPSDPPPDNNNDGESERKLKNKNREYSCTYVDCGGKFPTRNKLKSHRYSVHRANVYICLYCDKTFKFPFQKLRHQRIHEKKARVKKSSTSLKSKKVNTSSTIQSQKPFVQNSDSDWTRLGNNFDSDQEKIVRNSTKHNENDCDTTNSSSSLVDSDDYKGIPANKRVKKSSKSLKSKKKINKSSTIQNLKPFIQDSGTTLTRRVTRSRGKTFDSINSNTNEEKVDENSTKYAEIVKKISNSNSPNVKKSIIPISKSPIFEQIPQIKQEIDQDLPRRITKSPSKKQNYSNYFDSDEEKAAKNSTKNYEDDGDTSTAASLSSLIDSDDEYTGIPAKRVRKSHSVQKTKKVQKLELKPSEYLCYRCRESFTAKSAVRHHERNCQMTGKVKKVKKVIKVKKSPPFDIEIKCDFEGCTSTKIFSNKRVYKRHLNRTHYGKYRYKYKYKPRSTTTTTTIDGQKTVLKKSKKRYPTFCCRICRKYFKVKNDLKNHELTEHKIHCTRDNCLMVFVEQSDLDKHIRFKHFEQDKKHKCNLCPKKFGRVDDVRNHIATVHEKKHLKVCPFCAKELLAGYYKFEKHLDTHKVDGRGKVFCKICQIFLANYPTLEKHNLTEFHLKKMTIKSEAKVEAKTECTRPEEFILPDPVDELNEIDNYLIENNITFGRKVDEGIVVDKSELSEKAQKKIATCLDCGLIFRSHEYRQKHQVKFHGLKKQIFYCDICDATFAKKCSLDVHINKSRAHKINLEKKVLNK